MESKEPVYFICQSKLDALEEMLDNFTKKYSLYSKYAEGKLEGLLNESLEDFRAVKHYLKVELLKNEGGVG
jgi:hypothetical protein